MSKILNRDYDERYLKIKIISHVGDKIHLKLPIEFVKKMLKNNTIDFFYIEEDAVDSEKLLKILMNAFEYNLVGDIAYMERFNGDTIKLVIE